MHFSVEETTKEKNQLKNAQDRQAITLTQCTTRTFSVHLAVKLPDRCITFHSDREKKDYVSFAAISVQLQPLWKVLGTGLWSMWPHQELP